MTLEKYNLQEFQNKYNNDDKCHYVYYYIKKENLNDYKIGLRNDTTTFFTTKENISNFSFGVSLAIIELLEDVPIYKKSNAYFYVEKCIIKEIINDFNEFFEKDYNNICLIQKSKITRYMCKKAFEKDVENYKYFPAGIKKYIKF